MPRLAVDGYWRAHVLRADRLARALAARSGAPEGWTWRLGAASGPPATFRAPPAPYREPAFARGPRFLLRVRPAGLSLRLAQRSMGSRPQPRTPAGTPPACGVAVLERAERPRGAAPAAAGPPLHETGDASGRPRRSTIACRCSASGASTATSPGPRCWATGACPTCRSSIATRTPKSARAKRALAAAPQRKAQPIPDPA